MDEDIAAKIERSSLGTPEAKALRATVSAERASRIVARARELEVEDAAAPTEAPCECPVTTGPETPVGGGDDVEGPVFSNEPPSSHAVQSAPPTGLLEDGRRLASEREDLIAAGADPADLLVPIAPTEARGLCPHSPRCTWGETGCWVEGCPSEPTEARGLGERVRDALAAAFSGDEYEENAAAAAGEGEWSWFKWLATTTVDALLASAAAPEKCIACENGQILQTDRTQKTCGLCGGTGLAAAPETEGPVAPCSRKDAHDPHEHWDVPASEPGEYRDAHICRGIEPFPTAEPLTAQPAAEGAREDDGLATAIELAVLMTEADCASAEYPFSDLSRAKALLPWLAEDRRRARAEGGAEALEEAADDLLLDCSHFNRYRGKPEWCGYCESAVNMLRDRAAGLRETR